MENRERIPAQVTGEALASNFDWIIRTLDNKQTGVYIHVVEIKPMNEMEVLAVFHACPDAK
jgi:hypothetical protein